MNLWKQENEYEHIFESLQLEGIDETHTDMIPLLWEYRRFQLWQWIGKLLGVVK